MAEADWHLRDLLHFYVSKCRAELVDVSEDPVRAETVFESVKRVRELMILMSCMVAAFTPAEIAALQRLEQIRLVAENESARMLRIGEEMAMLRVWLKSAIDPQWNVVDAVKLMRSGRPAPASCFPEMTLDLITSVKKPFIVPSCLPDNADPIRRILQTSITSQFAQAKLEPPLVPDRVCLEFNVEDDSVIIQSKGEFMIRGIFDHRRWTIIEAQILDDKAGARQCRQVLQAISNSSIAEMCSAALRMATAQRLKIFQDEAVAAANQEWTSIHSVSKPQTGLGNGFTVGLYRKMSEFAFSVQLSMNFDNGDMQVTLNGFPEAYQVDGCEKFRFFEIIEKIESVIRKYIFHTHIPGIVSLPSITHEHLLIIPEAGVVVTLSPSGSLLLRLVCVPSACISVSASDSRALNSGIDTMSLVTRAHGLVQLRAQQGWTHCACNTTKPDEIGEVDQNFSEFFATVRTNADRKYVCCFTNGKQFEIVNL